MKSNLKECTALGACPKALEFIKKTYVDADFNLSDANKDTTLDWASWLLWKKDKRLLARINAGFAGHVLHLYEKAYPDDKRVRDCINVTIRWSQHKATDAELDKARAAVRAAVRAATRDAARAARDAARAARAAAWDAARAAARAAAWDAARDTARDAASAARAAEIAWQVKYFKQIIKMR